MSAAAVRWSLRLPWSSVRRLQDLVRLDAPGRVGDVIGRALAHLLDQPEQTISALVACTAEKRLENPRDRTQVCSWRCDPALIARAEAWTAAHPETALSWLVDTAIRCYGSVCDSRQGGAMAGLAARRYRRLCPDLIVLVDDVVHAA